MVINHSRKVSELVEVRCKNGVMWTTVRLASRVRGAILFWQNMGIWTNKEGAGALALNKFSKKSSSGAVVQQLLATFLGTFWNFWQIFANFGNFWQISAIFGKFWQILANFGNFWQLLATFVNFCQLLATFGKQLVATCGAQ